MKFIIRKRHYVGETLADIRQKYTSSCRYHMAVRSQLLPVVARQNHLNFLTSAFSFASEVQQYGYMMSVRRLIRYNFKVHNICCLLKSGKDAV